MVKKIETKEVNQEIDVNELKEDLKGYIDKQVKKSWTEEVEKSSKRLIREKNRRIIFRDIIIVLLLGVIAYLVYILYDLRFFDKYFHPEVTSREVINNKDNNKEETKEPVVEEPTLEELIEDYGYLLDNISINEASTYVSDYYYGNLTTELKNYLTLNTISTGNINNEEDYSVIEEDDFVNAYYKLFVDDYAPSTFDYNGNKVRYINKLEYYISDSILEKTDSNIVREITDIKVDDNKVIITTIEGIIKDKKLYNIVTEKEVKNFKNNSLINYSDKLNEVKYTFNNEKLVSLN